MFFDDAEDLVRSLSCDTTGCFSLAPPDTFSGDDEDCSILPSIPVSCDEYDCVVFSYDTFSGEVFLVFVR